MNAYTYNRLIDVTWTENRPELNIENCLFFFNWFHQKKLPSLFMKWLKDLWVLITQFDVFKVKIFRFLSSFLSHSAKYILDCKSSFISFFFPLEDSGLGFEADSIGRCSPNLNDVIQSNNNSSLQ